MDKVRVRSQDGRLLEKQQEFRAIYDYFTQAFSRSDSYSRPALQALHITPQEVQEAISLRMGRLCHQVVCLPSSGSCVQKSPLFCLLVY